LLLHEWQVDSIDKVSELCDTQWLWGVSIQWLQFSACNVSNACLSFVLRIHGDKTLSSLNSLDSAADAYSLPVPEHPPTAVSHYVPSLFDSSHTVSFRFVFGFPAEALPPIAAIRLRSSALSFLLRASPAIRAISDRRSGLSFSVLALPPSFPRARACGFLFFMSNTLTKRHA